MMDPDQTIVLQFTDSRATDGEDIASIIATNMPDADIRAVLDERGAVAEYTVTLHFDDPNRHANALFRLRDFFFSNDWPFDVEIT